MSSGDIVAMEMMGKQMKAAKGERGACCLRRMFSQSSWVPSRTSQ